MTAKHRLSQNPQASSAISVDDQDRTMVIGCWIPSQLSLDERQSPFKTTGTAN
ncbi:hypothetical protein EXN66_Car019703 [Channa argus]|uniref:Uncharacterized protein n=1 Tax=Channa argus TaxID=215402 RepID=A0A6G1QN85_CHAAH|nr:hypothetical protein EXN66_Car019703 [Channa argus]